MCAGGTKANHLVAFLFSRVDAAAGATEVQLSIGDDKPIDRVIRGEVPAGVLGLVSPDAVEAFPDVKGFKVLRVPLAH